MAYLYAPEEIEVDLNSDGDIIPPPAQAPRTPFTWAIPPKKVHASCEIYRENGRDVRGSSLAWIERRVQLVKARARKAARVAYIEDHKLEPSKRFQEGHSSQEQAVSSDTPQQRVFEPQPLTLGEIWPPVPVPTEIDVEITVTPVTYPRPSKDVLSMGRKLGDEFSYNWYYIDPDNVANIWTGEAGELRRQRGPPG